MSESSSPPDKRGVSRRTVTSAMAWAVPAIAVAAPVAAVAASGPPPSVLVGVACKLPGSSLSRCPPEIAQGIFAGDFEKAFALPLQVTNTTNKPIVLKPSITVTNVRDGNGNPTIPFNVQGIYPDYCTPIDPGESVDVLIFANSDNSANDDVYADVTVPWGHTCADTDHAPIYIPDLYAPSFPPCSTNTPFPEGAPTCTPPFYQN
ncbi:hypothetical protein [Microbacterium thalassium]|uniref:Uncharacterized protein n=1 Tax=Microbacterium thalassium TaxID=362649 RepID=A0A7X0KVJ1_9MICO|nr:hypothetical protein [Microbacterium thalassium]MBB6392119.1 hypothetical protein [Microbacterium thalassium]GLK24922.1 hypothetical protein GCM10017607_22400 [Microbacterium thalassium]